jgi:hypothetical protein
MTSTREQGSKGTAVDVGITLLKSAYLNPSNVTRRRALSLPCRRETSSHESRSRPSAPAGRAPIAPAFPGRRRSAALRPSARAPNRSDAAPIVPPSKLLRATIGMAWSGWLNRYSSVIVGCAAPHSSTVSMGTPAPNCASLRARTVILASTTN